MSGKIFYRVKSRKRDGATELVVVAVHDLNLGVYQKHLYLRELESMAASLGAELVELPPVPRHDHDMYQGEEDVDASQAI